MPAKLSKYRAKRIYKLNWAGNRKGGSGFHCHSEPVQAKLPDGYPHTRRKSTGRQHQLRSAWDSWALDGWSELSVVAFLPCFAAVGLRRNGRHRRTPCLHAVTFFSTFLDRFILRAGCYVEDPLLRIIAPPWSPSFLFSFLMMGNDRRRLARYRCGKYCTQVQYIRQPAPSNVSPSRWQDAKKVRDSISFDPRGGLMMETNPLAYKGQTESRTLGD